MADIVLGRNLDAATDSVSNIELNTLVSVEWDALRITAYSANDDPEVIEYYSGGLTGTLVATVTITYDAQNRITSVEAT